MSKFAVVVWGSAIFIMTSMQALGKDDILKELVPPKTGEMAAADSAVVIAVEDYEKLPRVRHARRDAELFVAFLVDTVGVPLSRVSRMYREAPVLEDMLEALERRSSEVGKEGTLWIYFAGHGAPSADGDALLLGGDTRPKLGSMLARGLKRSLLLTIAEKSHAKRVVIVLDACFTGLSREGERLTDERMVVNQELAAPKSAKVVLWAAAEATQTSGPCEMVRHGIFTYFLVGALSGWAGRSPSLEAAQRYLKEMMEASVDPTDRTQSPVLVGDPGGLTWVPVRSADLLPLGPSLRDVSLNQPCTPSAQLRIQIRESERHIREEHEEASRRRAQMAEQEAHRKEVDEDYARALAPLSAGKGETEGLYLAVIQNLKTFIAVYKQDERGNPREADAHAAIKDLLRRTQELRDRRAAHQEARQSGSGISLGLGEERPPEPGPRLPARGFDAGVSIGEGIVRAGTSWLRGNVELSVRAKWRSDWFHWQLASIGVGLETPNALSVGTALGVSWKGAFLRTGIEVLTADTNAAVWYCFSKTSVGYEWLIFRYVILETGGYAAGPIDEVMVYGMSLGASYVF